MISLTFFLQIGETITEGVKRISFLGLAEKVRGSAVTWVEDLLAHVFGVILNLYKWIFVDIVSFRLLSFIIFSHSLVNFIAEYQIECAIQFWDLID
jgi:hypothetical protein